jgi:hypothetical protein
VHSHSLLAIACGLGFCSLQEVPAAHAEDRHGAGGPDILKALLVQPAGWKAYYSLPGGHDKGEAEFLFETRGERVVAKIKDVTATRTLNCERDVTISSNSLRLDGCKDRGITLLFNPKDTDYPLKGRSQGNYEYRLKGMYIPTQPRQ